MSFVVSLLDHVTKARRLSLYVMNLAWYGKTNNNKKPCSPVCDNGMKKCKTFKKNASKLKSFLKSCSVTLLCSCCAVDGDSCLQPDQPLHSVPGPAAQHLLRLLADDVGAGIVHGGHADDAGWERTGRWTSYWYCPLLVKSLDSHFWLHGFSFIQDIKTTVWMNTYLGI